MTCTSSCPTRDHATMGECLRAKGVKVAYANTAGGWDYTAQKKLDNDLSAYRDARRQGIQPSGTNREAVDRAFAISDATGTPWQADTN